ncbi:Gfo/Idh/MocA family oxidoreductase [Planococcus sp. CP5-4]|uniref:Gfo/Idh/MocA family protein n=1 Tax=unclassified Planococcus (in: firmicutes) TaxID=2662419 RepID=UPI001C24BA80|nr:MULTISPECIES: Gfo/Idh/MocA family oxidoreductase [unclassified Planococcus (in: firmicutes)]MBU9675172.1 Gfo/Idh/MocA family oxidoreductase [Planococcus sp. CP5-4_YE]MBV0908047.1 Gfo/Idh/MocA family oxidoreductase [Planococcus sp. CP5-4_UN]MBW6062108.1 Gfo/Idh/MocA family oxidoreductase [Planococcus sp. CP5-4]
MNFAIIGCGFIAKKHALAINNIPNANLIAVCDRVSSSMDFYAQEYGAKTYLESKEMLKDPLIDVVCICTPSGLHVQIAEEVAAAKKHIVMEKPIAMTIEETDRIMYASKLNGVKLTVVHPNRFRTVVQETKKILDQNLLGKISHTNCLVNWNRGQEYYDQSPWRGTKAHDGGVLMNQAIHNLDLLLWFMGDPVEVFSLEATRLRDIEAEDVSTGVIRFENGSLANVQASTTVYSKNFEESITIFGEKGTIKIGGTNALHFEKIDVQSLDNLAIQDIVRRVEENPWGTSGHQKIIEEMIFAIQNNTAPAVTGEDGRQVLKLVLAFYESSASKKLISI